MDSTHNSWIGLEWFVGALVIFLSLYVYGTWTYDFYKRRNMNYIKPTIPFVGNSGPIVIGRSPLSNYTAELYEQSNGHRYIGTFEFRTPIILIRDLEVIKLIAVKHFDHFHDHRVLFNTELDPVMTKNLFVLKGKMWQKMRTHLTPIFTSSKLNIMFQLLWTCGEQVCDYLENCLKQQSTGEPEAILRTNMKDLYMRYTTDGIITIAFGQGIDSLKYPDNEFYLAGQDITNFKGIRLICIAANLLFPKLMKWFGIHVMSSKTINFLHNSLMETMRRRELAGETRPDLVQFLLTLKHKQLDVDDLCLDDLTLSSQSMIFLLAGMEGGSTTLYFLSYELAMNPDIQERLQSEIDSVLQDIGDKPTYDAIRKMQYLEMVVSETLRKYPSLPQTDRICTKDMTFPETDSGPAFTIRKGDAIQIPIYGIQHDPEYFPDPERFDPERFSEENKHTLKPNSYIPFGLGPRHCIGHRFVNIQVKLAAVKLLSRFTFVPVSNTSEAKKFVKFGFFLVPESGFELGLKLRNTTN